MTFREKGPTQTLSDKKKGRVSSIPYEAPQFLEPEKQTLIFKNPC